MARPAKPLKKKYGKLTVLSESVVDGRRRAKVKCTCGTTKTVLADALRSGRVESCGAPGCRANASKVVVDKAYNPRMPEALNKGELRRVWQITTRERKPVTVAEAARRAKVNVNTLYSILRNVRRAGGIDAFLKAVSA